MILVVCIARTITGTFENWTNIVACTPTLNTNVNYAKWFFHIRISSTPMFRHIIRPRRKRKKDLNRMNNFYVSFATNISRTRARSEITWFCIQVRTHSYTVWIFKFASCNFKSVFFRKIWPRLPSMWLEIPNQRQPERTFGQHSFQWTAVQMWSMSQMVMNANFIELEKNRFTHWFFCCSIGSRQSLSWIIMRNITKTSDHIHVANVIENSEDPTHLPFTWEATPTHVRTPADIVANHFGTISHCR